MNEKYLPIGTVVLLKGATKKLMITGFCVIPKNNQNVIYDYSGCMYPEGIISSDQIALFNHDQIDKIYFLGFQSDEDKAFKHQLNEALKNKTENQSTTDIPPIGPGL